MLPLSDLFRVDSFPLQCIITDVFAVYFAKGSYTLVKFVGKNISDIKPSLLAMAIRIISICVASPKVIKVSTIVTVTCRCHFHL